jgi:hypothetical protein
MHAMFSPFYLVGVSTFKGKIEFLLRLFILAISVVQIQFYGQLFHTDRWPKVANDCQTKFESNKHSNFITGL